MNEPSPVDLHLHSTASDGVLDPAALVAHVAACGVRFMALTDHDTVAGVEEARAAARSHAIQIVPGVELSARFGEREVHILGLFIDPGSRSLGEFTAGFRAGREKRMEVMVARASFWSLISQVSATTPSGAPSLPSISGISRSPNA